ncbi:hypothetical protein GCM10009835_41690 [Planosporangium flavigriseum]|uniref:Uncharacterized protein n=1 Tax=Planosporangium flavigriseum TaxID=373681 RepID=A0A8J3LM99_9ACTN|nr:hypothetical protein Pfl04_23380 [Planosporangium flavigriseum]
MTQMEVLILRVRQRIGTHLRQVTLDGNRLSPVCLPSAHPSGSRCRAGHRPDTTVTHLLELWRARVPVCTGEASGDAGQRQRRAVAMTWRLRTCPSFEAQAFRHSADHEEFDQESFVAALVAQIRLVAGFLVPSAKALPGHYFYMS